MATLPHFILPQQQYLGPECSTPKLHLQTPSTTIPGFGSRNKTSASGRRFSRPEPLRTVSTPPDSPTRTRASTMGGNDLKILHDSGAITPPPTPTKGSNSKASSISNAASISGIQHKDSPISTSKGRSRGASIEELERPGSTELKKFPYWVSDYEITDKKKPLGSGLWSDVYLAVPSLPKPATTEQVGLDVGAGMTPPITPVKSRASSLSKRCVPDLPAAYAIKFPASKSAKQVLDEEAKVLSYLSRWPEVERYIVPFYGQDTRTGALVLKAMGMTLETWIEKELNALTESARTQKLATIFPDLALNLLHGLEWMEDKGCTHADIKPSNIMLSNLSSSTLHAVYMDFSSSTLSTLPASSDAKTSAPLGGGTWDFLDPILVAKSTTSVAPSAHSDLWSLAITLLYLVIGTSPFECAGSNVFRRREIVKHGTPLAYTAYGDDGPRNMARINALSKALSFDMQTWFAQALHKDVSKRAGVSSWRRDLEGALR